MSSTETHPFRLNVYRQTPAGRTPARPFEDFSDLADALDKLVGWRNDGFVAEVHTRGFNPQFIEVCGLCGDSFYLDYSPDNYSTVEDPTTGATSLICDNCADDAKPWTVNSDTD